MEDGRGESKSRNNNSRSRILILVVVEDCRGVCKIPMNKSRTILVLILVVVEDGLGESPTTANLHSLTCLNPCFSGSRSRRFCIWQKHCKAPQVLTLVVVEDGHGGFGDKVKIIIVKES